MTPHPISNLVDLNHAWLLPRLFQQVIIPVHVAQELARNDDDAFRSRWEEVRTADWLTIRTPASVLLPEHASRKPLDTGETVAIALALELLGILAADR